MTGLSSGDVVVRARTIHVDELKKTVLTSYVGEKNAARVSKF